MRNTAAVRIMVVAAVSVVMVSCTCHRSDLTRDRRDWDALERELPGLDRRELVRRIEVFLENHPPNKKRIFGTHSRTPQHQARLRLEFLRGEIAREGARRPPSNRRQ
jgi:hypothetical protein